MSHGTVEVWMTRNGKTWYYPQWNKYIPNIKTLSYDSQNFRNEIFHTVKKTSQ